MSGSRLADYLDHMKQAASDVRWNITMRPSRRRELDNSKLLDELTDRLEGIKASIRAKIDHLFRVISQFGHIKVRYRGLAKNIAQLCTLFALSNPWMARRTLMGAKA